MRRGYKFGIGLAGAGIIFIVLGFGARIALRSFFYPVAPPMPPEVNESMPDILVRLEAILKTNAPYVSAGLQPGLPEASIVRLEQQYHVELPDDIRVLYRWRDGSPQTTNGLPVDFIPGHRFLPLGETLAKSALISKGAASPLQWAAYRILAGHRDTWICLFDDGAGDGYYVDPKRRPSQGAVFYNFTEDGSYLFFPSARNLMAGIAKCYESGIFHTKSGSAPPQLDEDFGRADKIWAGFGASNPR